MNRPRGNPSERQSSAKKGGGASKFRARRLASTGATCRKISLHAVGGDRPRGHPRHRATSQRLGLAVAGRRSRGLREARCTSRAAAIFGAGLVALYGASTFYHGARAPHLKRILQRFDHSAIFLLIAATYTPFLLVELGGGWSWPLLGLIWVLAIVGIVLQVAFPHARRWSVPLYLGMGWLVISVAEPLSELPRTRGLTLLVSRWTGLQRWPGVLRVETIALQPRHLAPIRAGGKQSPFCLCSRIRDSARCLSGFRTGRRALRARAQGRTRCQLNRDSGARSPARLNIQDNLPSREKRPWH